MEELIKVNYDEKSQRQLVSARELHKGLELNKRFSDWWKQNSKSFEENTDFLKSPEGYIKKSGKNTTRKYDDYLMTLDMAKELCMMSKTEKGKEVRKYFIQVEKNWNSPEMVMHRALEISSARVKELESKNNALLLQLEDAQPAVEFYEDFASLQGAISIKKFSGVLISKGLWNGSPNDLYADFRNRGFTLTAPGQWNNPSTEYIRKGWLVPKTGRNPYNNEIYVQALITPTGVEGFTDFYRKLAVVSEV